MRQIISLACALALLTACGDDDEPTAATSEARPASGGSGSSPSTPAPTETGPSRTGRLAGISWVAPEPFRPVEPSSRMRDAEYVFPEQEGEEPATMTVFFFGRGQGGSIRENVVRWVGQFQQPDGSDSMEAAQITERQVNGLAVTLVDVSGTYSAMMPGGGGGRPATDQRMLAAIVEAPEGPVFFKMVGGRSLVERAEPAFEELVSSFHPQ